MALSPGDCKVILSVRSANRISDGFLRLAARLRAIPYQIGSRRCIHLRRRHGLDGLRSELGEDRPQRADARRERVTVALYFPVDPLTAYNRAAEPDGEKHQ
jgi:hypothetical protein